MSIEKRKPTKEFYSELNNVIKYQIKSLSNQLKTREALQKAIEIARIENFDDSIIRLLMKDYFKDKLPKSTYYRILHKLKLIEDKQKHMVPMEHINYNNVLEQKDTEKDKLRYEDMILDKVEDIYSTEKYILDTARLFERLGYSEDKIFIETKRMCKSGGMGQEELEYVDEVLHWKYDTYRKLDENLKNSWWSGKLYLKIAVNLDIYGIPRDKISAKIKEIVIPIQGMKESYIIDLSLQKTQFADPNIAEMDYLAVWIKSITPRKYGGYVDDDRFKAEQEEKKIGIGDGRKHKVDERYCRHCIMK